MEDRKRLTLSELKVGLFVIVTSVLLAVAIFTIGSQVGLLEETFVAKTYLNNVSGLKPGDIVLLGGVEVGNVSRVDILAPHEEMPDTQQNERMQESLRRLLPLQQRLSREWEDGRQELERLRVRLDPSLPAAQAEELQRRIDDQETTVAEQLTELDRVRERIERARAGLQNIVVTLTIKEEYRDWIRRDSNISLGSVGLLGDKYIEISLGRSAAPPNIEELVEDSIFGERRRDVVLITGRTQAGFQELITGANDVLINFGNLSETLQQIMDRFEEGEGSIGKFFSDPSFYNNLNDTVLGAKVAVENASQLLTEVTRGEGTIPQLIQERELYDRVNASAEHLEQMMARVDSGEGTIGMAINDPAVYDNANHVLENIRGITARMDSGEGTLGRLSKDERLYEDLREALDQMSAFIKDVEEGKGTLGRLAKDEQLYENLNEVSSEVVKLIYDFRQNPKRFLTINFKLF